MSQQAPVEYGRVEWFRVLPFLLLHAACLFVFVVGWSPVAVTVALVALFARVFGLTAFYHRYFSHRAFKTNRVVQFLGALLGNMAGQRGPIWWAAHHRHHHRAADRPDDIHSPRQQGFLWSHMLWFMTREAYATDARLVKDWLKYPELRFLERFDFFGLVLLGLGMFGLGEALAHVLPELNTSGPQMLVWGFVLSTITLYHVTFSINSLAHKYGTRRFETRDDSRNNLWLALVTFGEGWHNNHHHFPSSARQGFHWWEIDISYYLIALMAQVGLVWDVKQVPAHVLDPQSSRHLRGALVQRS